MSELVQDYKNGRFPDKDTSPESTDYTGLVKRTQQVGWGDFVDSSSGLLTHPHRVLHVHLNPGQADPDNISPHVFVSVGIIVNFSLQQDKADKVLGW